MNFEDIQAILESGGEYRPVTDGVEAVDLGSPVADSVKEDQKKEDHTEHGDAPRKRNRGASDTNIRVSADTHRMLSLLQFSLHTAEGVRETLDSIIYQLIESGAEKAFSPDVMTMYRILLKKKR